MLLKDRICIVTGAASERGIGQQTARFFAEHGARVAIFDLDQASTQRAAVALPGDAHRGYACDITDADACNEAVAAVVRECGHLDVLVNNAGIAQTHKVMEIKPADYDLMMDVTLRGTLYMCQAVIPQMRERRAGSIVNIGSVAAQRGGGIFGGTHYTAAKGGVIALTKALARELAPDQIRVNVVCPSLVPTDIHGGAITAERRLQLISGIPLGRLGTTQDVAGACLFLASDLAAYVTGIELDVNGGSHIH
ncbi:MAG: SDR family oxidoreductase [Burkholderiaceae bacterium]|nr:SDR family oxidoreductase [Burkholderiaceae bacterium]